MAHVLDESGTEITIFPVSFGFSLDNVRPNDLRILSTLLPNILESGREK